MAEDLRVKQQIEEAKIQAEREAAEAKLEK